MYKNSKKVSNRRRKKYFSNANFIYLFTDMPVKCSVNWGQWWKTAQSNIQTRNFQRLFFSKLCDVWGKLVREKPQALVSATCVSLVVRKKLQKIYISYKKSALRPAQTQVNTVKMIESRSHVSDPHTHSLTFFSFPNTWRYLIFG